jgi:hypothetical protein
MPAKLSKGLDLSGAFGNEMNCQNTCAITFCHRLQNPLPRILLRKKQLECTFEFGFFAALSAEKRHSCPWASNFFEKQGACDAILRKQWGNANCFGAKFDQFDQFDHTSLCLSFCGCHKRGRRERATENPAFPTTRLTERCGLFRTFAGKIWFKRHGSER